jgi:hypothetical protein
MSTKILTKEDFFSIKEKDVYNEQSINSIVDEVKTLYPEKYEIYGKIMFIDYAKLMLLKNYFKNHILEIEKDVYVKWEDFCEVIRFENEQITQRFIGGVNNINLCDKDGEYLNKKLYGMLLAEFK